MSAIARLRPDPRQIEEIAHRALQIGRLLQQNGADTEAVEAAVARFATAFGCEANLMVSYEALLLTLVAGDHFRTKIGHKLPAMNVGMGAIEALNRHRRRGRERPARARRGRGGA